MGFSGKCGSWPERLKFALRQLAADSRGAEIAEAAAVLPLMFMMILGIFWFGQAFSMYGTITRAAQDGARAGAAPYCSTCGNALRTPGMNATSAIQAALTAAKLDISRAHNPNPNPPAIPSCTGSPGPVTCDSASSNVCVQTSIQLSPSVGGATGICGIAVTFQYPFQFKLPFTSLNNQQIMLTASARMRMENQ